MKRLVIAVAVLGGALALGACSKHKAEQPAMPAAATMSKPAATMPASTAPAAKTSPGHAAMPGTASTSAKPTTSPTPGSGGK